MGFNHRAFYGLRPTLYHITSAENVASIAGKLQLLSANALAKDADPSVLTAKRKKNVSVTSGEDGAGADVWLRDQARLNEANVDYEGGWALADFLNALNNRVYFWPGDEYGPNPHGQRQMKKYRTDAILRVGAAELFRKNDDPLFCKFESAAPRKVGGLPSPRGPGTFVKASIADFTPGKVVEVTFERAVRLPESCEVLIPNVSGWIPLGTYVAGSPPPREPEIEPLTEEDADLVGLQPEPAQAEPEQTDPA